MPGSGGGHAENTCLTLHTAASVNGKYLPNARSDWLPSQPVPALAAYAYQKASSLVPAIFGAICPETGATAGLILPWCNTDAMGGT